MLCSSGRTSRVFIYRGMRDSSLRSGTKLAREIQLTDWSTAGNLSNRSSGVQIPRDICTRCGRYLYSTMCSWIVNTLISAYRSYKDECRKTGNATPKKKPAFFDEVDEYLSGKPCTKPKSIVNSSQIVIGDGTEDCAEESKGNVENVPNLTCSSSSSSSSSNNNNKDLNKASKCLEPKKDASVTCTGELSKKTAYWRRARQWLHVTEHGRLALSTSWWVYFYKCTSKMDGIMCCKR